MRHIALALFLALSSAHAAAARSVTDSAGRVVEIPDAVNTVFAAGPPAMVLVYVMKPEALTGWPRAPHGHGWASCCRPTIPIRPSPWVRT